jgi:hypothetical protein
MKKNVAYLLPYKDTLICSVTLEDLQNAYIINT